MSRVVNRFGRWLYVAALCQLLAGPLVLGGLALLASRDGRLTVREADGGAERVDGSDRAAVELVAATIDDGTPALADGSTSPAKAPKPEPKPSSEGKGKLWLVDGAPGATAIALLARPEQVQTAWRNACHPAPGPAPPTPPPRSV